MCSSRRDCLRRLHDLQGFLRPRRAQLQARLRHWNHLPITHLQYIQPWPGQYARDGREPEEVHRVCENVCVERHDRTSRQEETIAQGTSARNYRNRTACWAVCYARH